MPSVAVKLTPEQAQSQKPVLRVENLHTYFKVRRMGYFKVGDVKALDGVSLELYPGTTKTFIIRLARYFLSL